MCIVNIKYALVSLMITIFSCQSKTIRVFSPDKSQSFVIKEISNHRYLYIGDSNVIPDTNYVLLLMNETSYNDELAGCWKKNDLDLELTIQGAEIIENKFDSTKYKFFNTLPTDSTLKIPSLDKFIEKPCFHFGFSWPVAVPDGGANIVVD
jgi:hypothetical protein